LNEIKQKDIAKHTNDYLFLCYYLLHERRPAEVADALHMHRNNVKYRIGRIEDEFGLDTNDPILRTNLILAYQILGDDLLNGRNQVKPEVG
jgi:sugar diacid utilization regulator